MAWAWEPCDWGRPWRSWQLEVGCRKHTLQLDSKPVLKRGLCDASPHQPQCWAQCRYCSVAQSCQTLCGPVDCSTPGFPVHHHPRSLLGLMSIESVMPSNPLILCHPLLLLPSTFPSIRVFSNKSVLHIQWPKYWSFNFNISLSNEYSVFISFPMDWFVLLAVRETLKSLLQHHSLKHQFSGIQVSLESDSHIHLWLLEKPYLWLYGLLLTK